MSNSFELVDIETGCSTITDTPPVITEQTITTEQETPKPTTKPKSKAKPKTNLAPQIAPQIAQPITEAPKAKAKPRAKPKSIPTPQTVETVPEVPKEEIKQEEVKEEVQDIKDEKTKQTKSQTKLQEKHTCPHCNKEMSLKVLRYTHPNKCTVLNKVMKKNTKPDNNKKEVEIITDPQIIEAPKQQIEHKEPVIMKNKYELKNERIDKMFGFLKA